MQAVEQGWVQRGGRAGRQPGAGDQGGEWDCTAKGLGHSYTSRGLRRKIT